MTTFAAEMNADSEITEAWAGVSSRVRDSAEKLERHIRASGLKPGDKYLTAEEGGRLLGESVMTVQRAMGLLAKGDILERRPKAGTFIGKAVAPDVAAQCVHILLPEQAMHEPGVESSYWRQIRGMREVLPDLSVQFNFIPNQDVAYAQRLMDQLASAGQLVGVMLVLPSRQMRSYFNDSGIPTVVAGGVESDLTNLGWVDWDQKQTGRLLAEYLVARGHERFATVMRDVWSIGEHMLHDGIGEAVAEAGLASNAVRVRSAPAEASVISGLAHDLLTESPPTTAFICRTEFQADCVQQAAEGLGLGGQVEVVLCTTVDWAGHVPRYTYARPEIDSVEQGRIIARMFEGQMKAQPLNPRGRHIAVELQQVANPSH